MRFAIQAGIEDGVHLAEADIERRLMALLDASDWSTLDVATLALGLIVARQEDAAPWLEALASADPTLALSLAFEVSRYSLRFARSHGVIARVVERVDEPASGALPTAEFWRELRRASDADPPRRAALRRICEGRELRSLRVRAGLSFLFPELWTQEDDAAAVRVVDPDAGALMLLALLRNDPAAVDCLVWPPPPAMLLALPDPVVAAALRWYPGDQRRALFGIRVALRRLDDDLEEALGDLGQLDMLAALRAVKPTPRIVARLRAMPRSPRAGTAFLRSLLIDRWEAALKAVPRSAPHPDPRQRFLDWLMDGAPASARWPLEELARFPTPAAIDALAQLAQAWAPTEGLRPLALVDTIALAGGPTALARLFELANARIPAKVREHARSHLEALARHDGLTTMEQEDRLFPALSLRPGERVTLSDDGVPGLERDGAPLALKGPWKKAAKQVPAALRRLERLMCELPPMSAIHFTETWGMNPLLSALAERFVWASFRDGVRRSLFVPGRPPAPELDDRAGVRPVHPSELTPEELVTVRKWVAAQPFAQLERPVVSSLPRIRDDSFGMLYRARAILVGAGWEATSTDADDPSFTRGGEGWQATLVLAGQMSSFGSYQLEPRLELDGTVDRRITSELYREVSLAIAGDEQE